MRVGSLCSGIGGLDQAAGGDVVWFAESDPAPASVMQRHHPHAVNLGDWTAVDRLPDVDLITGGLPCQPVSTAGHRTGTDDERWLFDDLTDALGRMGTRPDLFLENVPGLLSANGGDAMARIVHGLAGLGYVGRWRTVRASDIGAPHRRERWFCVASYPDSYARSQFDEWAFQPRLEASRRNDAERRCVHAEKGNASIARLLPTPTASEHTGPGHAGQGGENLRTQVAELLLTLDALHASGYGPAVRRWEQLTRPCPPPTDDGRLAVPFVEWMMGFPAGYVGPLGRTKALKALGNAVVPQQAAHALALLTCKGRNR